MIFRSLNSVVCSEKYQQTSSDIVDDYHRNLWSCIVKNSFFVSLCFQNEGCFIKDSTDREVFLQSVEKAESYLAKKFPNCPVPNKGMIGKETLTLQTTVKNI